ncbi:MAG: cofactor-independent phosphoglycerate mutase [Candidatus Omnitrophota bacterium]|jgi:2,3-bisphosphoglycerate-independent phosphoglycerate mutase|nr:MAG: cofactor-independent phosphoglycerate mutase [Candidatus Omnitrophota bacterium]
MKYIVLVCDGMADYPVQELAGKTPLEAARTPHMDLIARLGRLGRVKTVPDSMEPASDVANISVLGYDPEKYYTGRGPLEAANLGVELREDDVAFRCNMITVLHDALTDYSAGHIRSEESKELILFLNQHFATREIRFYPGVSYRNLMVVRDGAKIGLDKVKTRAPHDILGQNIQKHLPKGKGSDVLIRIMEDSRKLLEHHEINQVRVDLKENPATMIWLWGQGKRPSMPTFLDKYGLSGSVISAVDLIKGLGRILGLEAINVPGATGYYDTDYKGKAKAAIKSLTDKNFVFLHVEAADEAGHNGDLREKILAIERFDTLVVGTILQEFNRKKNFRILVLPDHPTPVELRTHVSDPVLFGIYGKGIVGRGFAKYCEKEAIKSKLYFSKGHELMDYFIRADSEIEKENSL